MIVNRYNNKNFNGSFFKFPKYVKIVYIKFPSTKLAHRSLSQLTGKTNITCAKRC